MSYLLWREKEGGGGRGEVGVKKREKEKRWEGKGYLLPHILLISASPFTHPYMHTHTNHSEELANMIYFFQPRQSGVRKVEAAKTTMREEGGVRE